MTDKVINLKKPEDIKIEITVSPNKITWKSNADIMALTYYLDRVKYLVQKKTDELDKQIENDVEIKQ